MTGQSARRPNVKRPRGWKQFRWTETFDSILAAAYAKGMAAENIVALIGCSTVGQITNRAARLKLKHRKMNRTLEERFWDYVSPEPNSGCWLWEGSIDQTGYGQLRVATSGSKSLARATHISLMLAERPLPDGLNACHRCDNTYCVNPDHLFAGTQLDNMRDSMAKGRHSKPPLCKKGSRPIRTICVNGHYMSPDNTLTRPDGFTACRACMVAWKARRRAAFVAQGLNTRGKPRVAVP